MSFSSAPRVFGRLRSKGGRRGGDFGFDPREIRRQLIQHGYEELPVTGQHAMAIDSLPAIHHDPFARILIAQTLVEGITLLTTDKIEARYPGPIRKV